MSNRSLNANDSSTLKLSRWFMRLAIVYVLIGMGLGMYMGMKNDFTLMPVHAHINLLGWVSSAVFALVYRLVPHMSEGKLPWAHFWVATVGLLFMTVGLVFFLLGQTSLQPLLETGSSLSFLGMLIFGKIVFSKF